MSYHIHITSAAERDLVNAADHIDLVLKNPQAANDLFDAAENQLNSPADFPEKYPLVDDSVLASWGIRFVLVKNYLAFYTTNKRKKLVIIVRFLHQKNNWRTILHQGLPLV